MVEPGLPLQDFGLNWALLIEKGWWRKRVVCSLVKGGPLPPSWRSTAEHSPEWLGSNRRGTACYSSLVGQLLQRPQPLPLLLAVGHWPRSIGPGC